MARLQAHTTEEERMVIHSIHLRKQPGKDRLNWTKATNGMARPKLVYRRIREEAYGKQSNMNNKQGQVDERKWKQIWRNDSIPKVKTFLWRAMHKALPVTREEESESSRLATSVKLMKL